MVEKRQRGNEEKRKRGKEEKRKAPSTIGSSAKQSSEMLQALYLGNDDRLQAFKRAPPSLSLPVGTSCLLQPGWHLERSSTYEPSSLSWPAEGRAGILVIIIVTVSSATDRRLTVHAVCSASEW